MDGRPRRSDAVTGRALGSSSSPKEGSPGLLPDAILFRNGAHVSASSLTNLVLWDVDTQVDFMLPEGKLYVPGAEETVPTMKRLVDAARAAGVVHVASVDDHELTDEEISDSPDFITTYPPHCLRGTRGACKIPETEQEN